LLVNLKWRVILTPEVWEFGVYIIKVNRETLHFQGYFYMDYDVTEW